MAIDIISSEEKTENGTITVPESCTLIVAVVDGSVEPPKISGISMGVIGAVEATSIIPAISVHQFQTPQIDTLSYTFTGTTCEFVFLSDADTYRPGTILGYNSEGVFGGDLPSADGDLVLAILHGSVGPTTLECDEVEMTYLKDSTLVKIGFVLAASALIACLASDTGVSEGYYADGGQYWVEGSYTPGYWEYTSIWVPGYYEEHYVWVPDHWEQPDPQEPPIWVPGHYEYHNVWVPGHWEPYRIWHDPVTIPGYWEDYPDIWVPAGTSQISACFCSIKTTAGEEMVSSPLIFQ